MFKEIKFYSSRNILFKVFFFNIQVQQ